MHNSFEYPAETFAFWKNLILFAIFFTVTPVALGTSLFALFSLHEVQVASESLDNKYASVIHVPKSGIRVYASLPTSFPSVGGAATAADARVEIVRQYLERYNSPLVPLSSYLVETADRYDLDFRLLPAIAQQESNLCKIIPPQTYNCWGWGIHSRGTLGFSSYNDAIDAVAKGLREEYLNKGYGTIEEIMSKYTPLSNGSWAFGVNKFMSDME